MVEYRFCTAEVAVRFCLGPPSHNLKKINKFTRILRKLTLSNMPSEEVDFDF